MIKLYIKQAFYQLRENRLISLVSIIGTALAICMIMVIVLVLEVRITDCVPEVNRSRSLYMKAMSIHQKGDTSDNSSNGCMSLTVAKECFKALTVPEAVTIVSTGGRMRISVPAGKMMTVDNLETDDTFWKVFSFDFIAGKPFTAADSESGLPKVVLSASVARNLFGTVEAVGRTVQPDVTTLCLTQLGRLYGSGCCERCIQTGCFFLCADLDTFQFNRNSQEVLV